MSPPPPSPDARAAERPVRSIRTPDQRLRVFVSSTLKELAAERGAARTAIERLRLAPVMFELGSRPHPPRSLYRAYLQQSDVFVGIYARQYGWQAPDEKVSGLEDEYNLIPQGMPRLIYIVRTDEPREPRLTELLNRIRDDDSASYSYVSSPEELERTLEGDLSTLLAERFDQSRDPDAEAGADPAPERTVAPLPVPLTPLIGREDELDRVESLLRDDTVRLVSLVGPGGIGKSRLGIEIATRQARSGRTAVFVDLAPLRDPAAVMSSIARALGVRDTGDRPLGEKVALAVQGRRILLVLDNFEQVAAAGPELVRLLSEAPLLAAVVTSRVILRLSGERVVEVAPLALPAVGDAPDAAGGIASVELFVDRARAVRPDFELTDANADVVARICLALDGVPLAIELAAAQSRVLPPQALLARLERSLPMASAGARDLPERQRTLRSTIEWSTRLLRPEERDLLEALSVFVSRFSLPAAEHIARSTGADVDVLAVLGALVDGSLLRQEERMGDSAFSMLSTVREWGRERLGDEGRLAALRDAHARYFASLGESAEDGLEGTRQGEWMARISDQRDDVVSSIRFLLDEGRLDEAAAFMWRLYVFWWAGGQLGQVRGWADEVLASGRPVSGHTRAIALYFTRAIGFWQRAYDDPVPAFQESAALFRQSGDAGGEAVALISLALARVAAGDPGGAARGDLDRALELFRATGDRWGEGMALVTTGRLMLGRNETEAAAARFAESLDIARRDRDELSASIALYHTGWAALQSGDAAAATRAFEENLRISARLGHDDGIAYGLEGMVALAAGAGDAVRAGRLLGAAEVLRERTGLSTGPGFALQQPYVDRLRASDDASVFEAARRAGRDLTPTAAVGLALGTDDG